MNKKINLNKDDIIFLLNEVNISSFLKNKLNDGDKYLNLNEKELIELDDNISDQLCYDGFDENYEITLKGKKLEYLIDKIYEMLENYDS